MAKTKRILVTGNNGYIGSVMAPWLQRQGYDVVGLDTDYFLGCTLVPDLADIPTIRKDIRDVVPEDLRGFDARYPLPTERDGPIDWLDLMDSLSAAFVSFTLGQEKLHDVLYHSDFTRRRPPKDNAAARLTAIIRAAQEAGEFADLDPEPTGRLVFALVHDAADAVSEGADRARTLAELSVVLRRALGAQGDKP